jgi:LacI family transcriptional regulator
MKDSKMQNNRKVTTLNDVATEAGVNKSTVSRILNNRLGNGFSVTEEVRKRVLAAAEKLSYRPNLIAKGLTLQTTRMIHIIGGRYALSDLGNIYQTVVNSVTGIMDCSEDVFDVTVDMSHHDVQSSELPPWKIDGAIILARANSSTLRELEDSQIPYVVVNGPAGKSGSSVVPDDECGTKITIQYLAELGHLIIAYANSRPDYLVGHSSLADRHQTYLREMKKLGLSVAPGHDEWLKSAEEFLTAAVIENGATVVLAYGHMEGLNLMQAAHKLGITVPGRLSVLCFYDQQAAAAMSPLLSFIDLRSSDMGRIAAELLLKHIKKPGNAEPTTIKLAEELVIRNSTASPQK